MTVSGADIAAVTNGSEGGTCGAFLSLAKRGGSPGLDFNTGHSSPGFIDLSQNFEASDASTPTPLSTGRYVDCDNAEPVLFPLPNIGYINSTALSPDGSNMAFQTYFALMQGTLSGVNPQANQVITEYFSCSPLGVYTLLTYVFLKHLRIYADQINRAPIIT